MTLKPEAVIKTALAFKDGFISTLMTKDLVAANAVATFGGTTELITKGVFRGPNRNISDTDHFKQMLHIHALWDEREQSATEFVSSLSEASKDSLIESFILVVDDMIDAEIFPLENGKESAAEIISHMRAELAH